MNKNPKTKQFFYEFLITTQSLLRCIKQISALERRVGNSLCGGAMRDVSSSREGVTKRNRKVADNTTMHLSCAILEMAS